MAVNHRIVKPIGKTEKLKSPNHLYRRTTSLNRNSEAMTITSINRAKAQEDPAAVLKVNIEYPFPGQMPKVRIRMPHKVMAVPAKACVYFSKPLKETLAKPLIPMSVKADIVRMVVKENIRVTPTKATVFSVAAGNINKGIKGSQGPKTNRINRLQIVLRLFFG